MLQKSQQAIIAKGILPNTQQETILKRYQLNTQREAFIKELKLLSKLSKNVFQTVESIPELISYKTDKIFAEILMADAGIDLTQLLCGENNQQSFNKYQIGLQVGFQVLCALEQIHQNGYIHCDIKLDNICSKSNTQNENTNIPCTQNSLTYTLIDFGLASKFTSKGKHLIQESIDFFKGNILFASENAIKLKSQSRKDDLESLMYLVTFIINELSLPWIENIDDGSQIADIFQFILKRRIRNFNKFNEKIMKMLPNQLKQAFKYIRNLEFQDTPDYQYLKSLFQSLIQPQTEEACHHNWEYQYLETFGQNNLTCNQKYQEVAQSSLIKVITMNEVQKASILIQLENNDESEIQNILKEQLFEIEDSDLLDNQNILADRSHYQGTFQEQERILSLQFKQNFTLESKKYSSIQLLQRNFEQQSTNSKIIIESFLREDKSFNSNKLDNQEIDEELEEDLNCSADTDENSINSGSQSLFVQDFTNLINRNDLKCKL
ncbi:tau-tubulin kinase 1 [Stylonychia lemnae]|uniref:Casein kinase I n=1 Tax=Stylonychia lemnae TaxID=5949 RepID=A0A077ZVA0_STYLE|nr:tau-tubulin kinase 1 [Stylonychia lemnae]|eukprot:CDW72341.1 tau-tubulin kinase 1 [Stylonychia lemnae]